MGTVILEKHAFPRRRLHRHPGIADCGFARQTTPWTVTAVALARQLDVELPDVPLDKLRAALRDQHVELDWPRTAAIEAHRSRE